MSEQPTVRRTLYPTLRYVDADKAIVFLKDAFGFEEHEVHRGDDGRVQHAELVFEGGIVMVGEGEITADAVDITKGGRLGLYVAVDDADAHQARAAAAGAEIACEVSEKPYGAREYAAKDLEGVVWYFGTYRP